MIFNGVDLGTYFSIIEIRGRGLVSQDVSILSSSGSNISHVSDVSRPPRVLEIVLDVKGNIREKIDELNGILSVKESVPITFSDEPNKTYFGIPQASSEDTENHYIHRGTLTIICPDPYKYGPEKTEEFTDDVFTLRNGGTTKSSPIFELEVTSPTTLAMVQKGVEAGAEYQMIGRPVEEDGDEQIVDTKTSVLYENGSTVDEWLPANDDMVDTNFIDLSGSMGSDSSGVRPTNWGTGNKMHGPAIYKELTSPIQDFEIETSIDINSTRPIENWRAEIYFHDENMNMLGKLGIKDNNRSYLRRHGLGRVGPYQDARTGYAIGSTNYLYDDSRELTLMYLRVRREGQRYTFYIAQWFNLKHTRALTAVYNDVNNNFQGKLKYITLFIGKYKDRPTPSRLRINSVEVFELNSVTENQTPYIVYPGDVITFDHENDEILLNGEDRKDLKNFGGKYFELDKGDNQIVVNPPEAFITRVKYRERLE